MNGKSALLVLSMVLVGSIALACSSSSSSTATRGSGATAATTGATTAAQAATTIATTVSGGKDATCSKIPLADVQALTPQTLQASTDSGIGECLYHNAGQDVTVAYFVDDADQSAYKGLSGSTDHQLAGVGDEAYWNETPPGHGPPALNAHKGNVTCIIESNDPPDTTLKYSGSEPSITVSDADALAYVQLLAKVCDDVFAAQ